MPRPAVPFRLRPGADKYYTRQDILDLVTFSRYTLFRKLKEKSMVMPVPTVEGLDYPYHLWRRDEFHQWLQDNPQYDREKKPKGGGREVRVEFKVNEMALIKLASQCALQLEADTEEFIRTAAITYANQVLRLTHDDFIRQMQRENPELSVYDTEVLAPKLQAYFKKLERDAAASFSSR